MYVRSCCGQDVPKAQLDVLEQNRSWNGSDLTICVDNATEQSQDREDGGEEFHVGGVAKNRKTVSSEYLMSRNKRRDKHSLYRFMPSLLEEGRYPQLLVTAGKS